MDVIREAIMLGAEQIHILREENKQLKEQLNKHQAIRNMAIKYVKDNEVSLEEQKTYYAKKDIKIINIPSEELLDILEFEKGEC